MGEGAARPAGLSVVIPSYGRPVELLEAVESVAAGDPARVEILVIDDATPAGPASLPAANRSGVPIRLIVQPRNRGPQAARNLGIRRARFSHIAFLDSDDLFEPAKIDLILQLIDSGGWDLLFHPVLGLERYGRIARRWYRQGRPIFGFRALLALLNPVATPGLVVRRKLRLGPPSLRHAEDYAFLLRYVEPQTRVRFLDEFLASVRRGQGEAGGLSADVRRMRQGEFKARRVLLKERGLSGLLRWLVGSAMGLLRMLNDRLRGRYA